MWAKIWMGREEGAGEGTVRGGMGSNGRCGAAFPLFFSAHSPCPWLRLCPVTMGMGARLAPSLTGGSGCSWEWAAAGWW